MNRILTMAVLLLVIFDTAAREGKQQAAEQFAKESGVPRGSLAVRIIDLADNSIVASVNSDTPLIPASIMKTVSIASLLDKAGEGFVYRTPVWIDGPVEMGIVKGNLVVEGSGDPSLHSPDAPGSSDLVEEITEALRIMGIHAIEGSIVVDGSCFSGPSRPESWVAADRTQSYGTGSHGFNFEGNASGKRSIERPDRVFAARLRSALMKVGIAVSDKDTGDGERQRIMEHVSAPVDEIMRSCMMRSDNLYAESMFRTFGKLSGGDGSHADAAVRERVSLEEKGLPMEGIEIVDGSGLSRDNRVTADFMGALLAHKGRDAVYASFFPLAGQEGTLKKFLADTPLDGYIAMKTGSMNGIQCYAGYKLDDDYAPTHVVVIIMNNIGKSRDRAKRGAQKMLLDIFED